MDPDPLARELLGDRGADGRAEHFGAPAGQAREPRLLHREQDVALRDLLDARKMGDLDRRQRLDVDARMACLEAAQHVRVVAQPEFGVQAADDVEFRRGHPAGLPASANTDSGVGAVFLGIRDRTEHAGVASTYTLVIDVLRRRRPDPRPLPVREIGQSLRSGPSSRQGEPPPWPRRRAPAPSPIRRSADRSGEVE
jgi:hypothetical protein